MYGNSCKSERREEKDLGLLYLFVEKEQYCDTALYAPGIVQQLLRTNTALPNLYATHKLNEIGLSMIKLNCWAESDLMR